MKTKGFLNGGSFLFVNFTLAIMKPINKNYFKEVTMNKEKIKKFWEENKMAIAVGIGCGVGCLFGGAIMYKAGKHDAIPWAPEAREAMSKIIATGPKGRYPLAMLVDNDGIETKDLGELGKRFIEAGGSSSTKYMRFIAISDEAVSK